MYGCLPGAGFVHACVGQGAGDMKGQGWPFQGESGLAVACADGFRVQERSQCWLWLLWAPGIKVGP